MIGRAKATLMALVGSEELLVSAALADWKDVARELRQMREVGSLRREIVIGRAKATLMALAGAEELLVPAALAGGKEVVRELRQAR